MDTKSKKQRKKNQREIKMKKATKKERIEQRIKETKNIESKKH